MSSRQEEKEQRKRERIERERAEAAAAQRKRLTMVGAGAVVAAVIVALIVIVGLGGKDDKATGPERAVAGGAPIPARKITDLDEAAKAAGCTVKAFPEEGSTHIADDKSFDGYKTNPPTSGNHHLTPAQDGIYTTGNEPAKESWVHTLEHGRIILQYKAGTPTKIVAQLQTLFNEDNKGRAGYHMVLLQNNTKMPFEVAAVAWRNYVGCNTVNDKTWDALRAFRDAKVDKAPELIP